MHTVELSDQLFDYLTSKANGKPIEAAIWALIDHDKMANDAAGDAITLMLGTALGVPKEQLAKHMSKRSQEVDKERKFNCQ